jgi:hypothetical protein
MISDGDDKVGFSLLPTAPSVREKGPRATVQAQDSDDVY